MDTVTSAADESIDAFLNGSPFAVVGASRNPRKYGNKVLRCYIQAGRRVYAVNPAAAEVEGCPSYPTLSSLPEAVHGISLITQPMVSQEIVEEAVELGIHHLWFQPGAEHEASIAKAIAAGANVIAHGPCILVVLGYRGSR